MNKGQITPRQFDRFAVIDKFIKRKGRMPVNREVCEMFSLKSAGSSFVTLKRYFEWKATKVETNKAQS